MKSPFKNGNIFYSGINHSYFSTESRFRLLPTLRSNNIVISVNYLPTNDVPADLLKCKFIFVVGGGGEENVTSM